MERIINRYDFSYETVSPYFIDHVGCGKTLSERLVERIDFRLGKFYTFLPDDILKEWLYDFAMGNVLYSEPHVPITTHLECSEFIHKFLQENDTNCAVIGDFVLEPTSKFIIKDTKMTPYKDEVYYFLNKNYSSEEILKTIERTGQIWHTLIILTSLENGNEIVLLNEEIINQICDNTIYVIASAYDGDGHIYWERIIDCQKLKLN